MLRRDSDGLRGGLLSAALPAPGIEPRPGGAPVACPAGFSAAAGRCGLKPSGGNDLALIASDRDAAAAAVFTTNRVQAAPIQVCREHLALSGGRARAILINAGIANAATGPEGRSEARSAAEELAGLLACPADRVLVNSTGVIGVPLPPGRIAGALPGLVSRCAPEGLRDAALAIMTTDTRPKLASSSIDHGGRTAQVTGIAKGAGMIHPDLATMIVVLLTDAEVEPRELGAMLRRAVERSFHRITVDGDTSTNDAVYLLASGRAGGFPAPLAERAVADVARELAIAIARDGEGATKLIRVRAGGAANPADALAVARTVASSLLVRTAVAGGDPNWGRIVAAAGRSGVSFDLDRLEVRAGGVPLYARGRPAGTDREAQAAAFAGPEVLIEVDLGRGEAAEEFFTCDLTERYVQINARYTT